MESILKNCAFCVCGCEHVCVCRCMCVGCAVREKRKIDAAAAI